MRARAAAEREATKKDEGAKRRRKAKLDTECACNAMLVAKMERERDEALANLETERACNAMLVADAAARRQERDEARQELDLIKMRAADHAREVGSVIATAIENATLPLEERIRHLEGPPAGDADGAPFGEHALEGACDCCICDAGARGSKRFELCTRCGAAYDRWQRSQDEDGTIWGVMVWAARRAVRAERRRVKRRKRTQEVIVERRDASVPGGKLKVTDLVLSESAREGLTVSAEVAEAIDSRCGATRPGR